MANKQAILGSGARFSGKISNAKSIEINGYVEADLTTEKVTIENTKVKCKQIVFGLLKLLV